MGSRSLWQRAIGSMNLGIQETMTLSLIAFRCVWSRRHHHLQRKQASNFYVLYGVLMHSSKEIKRIARG